MRLSICIPAYGRQSQITELLESISTAVRHSAGVWHEVEVVVSDNASTPPLSLPSFDGVGGLSVRLIRQSSNIGASRNFIAAALAATGDYCWWMGSDDAIDQDALLQIHQQVKRAGDGQLWVFDRFDWHSATGRVSTRAWYRGLAPEATFDLTQDGDIVKLADASMGVGGLFSFLGSLIFRRDCFSFAGVPDSIFKTAYPHVYILLRARPRVVCNIPPVVKCRIGDDSFADHSALRRLLVDIDGYTTVLSELKWPEAVRASIDQAVERELAGNYFKGAANTLNLFVRSNPQDIKRMRYWLAPRESLPVSIKCIGWLPTWVLAIVRIVRRALKALLGKR